MSLSGLVSIGAGVKIAAAFMETDYTILGECLARGALVVPGRVCYYHLTNAVTEVIADGAVEA